MGDAASRSAGRHSHLLGTGVSIGVHLLLAALVLLAAANAPRSSETPVRIAPLTLMPLREGPRGAGAGRGRTAPAERVRQVDQASAARDVTPRTALNVTPPAIIPATTVVAASTLPGHAIAVDPLIVARGTGPGMDDGRGAGAGERDGAGRGAGRDGAFAGDGDGAGLGDGVTAPQLLREVKPAYTVDAMRAKIQGRVELDVLVLPDGSVDARRIRIVRSLDSTFGLDAQAIEAVKQWRFRPGTFNNRPAAVRVRVELTFTLR